MGYGYKPKIYILYVWLFHEHTRTQVICSKCRKVFFALLQFIWKLGKRTFNFFVFLVFSDLFTTVYM